MNTSHKIKNINPIDFIHNLFFTNNTTDLAIDNVIILKNVKKNDKPIKPNKLQNKIYPGEISSVAPNSWF